MNLKKLVDAMDAQVAKGEIIAAFDQYAADQCATLSNAADKTHSKVQKMEALRWFFGNIAQVNHIERVAVKLLNDTVSDSQFVFDFTNHAGQSMRFEEVIRRTWANGLVVEELYLLGQTIEVEPSASAPAKKAAPKANVAPKVTETTAKSTKTTAAPKKASPAPKKADDLTLVEGIGPKIAELLHAAGIVSFADLAAAKPAALKNILESAGKRYQMHDPATWPKQALLARDGKMAELTKLQAELKGGK